MSKKTNLQLAAECGEGIKQNNHMTPDDHIASHAADVYRLKKSDVLKAMLKLRQERKQELDAAIKKNTENKK